MQQEGERLRRQMDEMREAEAEAAVVRSLMQAEAEGRIRELEALEQDRVGKAAAGRVFASHAAIHRLLQYLTHVVQITMPRIV